MTESVLKTAITMFLILAVGFIAGKMKIIDSTASKRLSTLVICVGQPFMIINSQISLEYSADRLKNGFLVLGAGLVIHGIMSVIAYFTALKIKDMDTRKITEYTIIFANCGFMGYPLLESMLGDIGMFYGSFYIIVFNLVVFTWGMIILGRGRKDIKMNPKKMILNYGTVPCVIGLLLYILQLPIPAPLASAASYLGSVCTPLSLLVTGALLATMTPKQIFAKPQLYLVSLMKLVALPILICVLAKMLGFSDTLVYFFTLMSGMPSAANAVLFAETYDVNPSYAASTVGVTTLFSVATIPLIIWFTGFIL